MFPSSPAVTPPLLCVKAAPDESDTPARMVPPPTEQNPPTDPQPQGNVFDSVATGADVII